MDRTDLMQLSEETKTVLHMIEYRFETKLNELFSILESKNEKMENLVRENATLKKSGEGILDRL